MQRVTTCIIFVLRISSNLNRFCCRVSTCRQTSALFITHLKVLRTNFIFTKGILISIVVHWFQKHSLHVNWWLIFFKSMTSCCFNLRSKRFYWAWLRNLIACDTSFIIFLIYKKVLLNLILRWLNWFVSKLKLIFWL